MIEERKKGRRKKTKEGDRRKKTEDRGQRKGERRQEKGFIFDAARVFGVIYGCRPCPLGLEGRSRYPYRVADLPSGGADP